MSTGTDHNHTHDIQTRRLADAVVEMHLLSEDGTRPEPNAFRLAFADTEFLLRRETRGIRFQLELLKPDLEQQSLGIDNTIVVFGSARFREPAEAERQLHAAQASGDPVAIRRAQALLRNAHYYEKSRRFAQLVAEYSQSCPKASQLHIATGGGPGIMEAANRGAHDRGALNVGLNILLPHEQEPNPYISPELSFKFHYFALRKMHFLMRAKALVAFPGGFGTLDELFEVLTLVQCKKAKPVPIFLFGSDYWKRHQRLGAHHEVHLAQGEVVELEAQLGRHIGVGLLLVRQHDVQRHRRLACIVRTAVGCFHDARAAAGADVELLVYRQAGTVVRDDAGKFARLFVPGCIAQGPPGLLQCQCIIRSLRLCQLGLRDFLADKAGAAKHHHRVFDACLHLGEVRFLQLQLHADAACLAAQQKLRIGKRQPVSLWLDDRRRVLVGQQFGPCAGQRGILDVVGILHVRIVRHAPARRAGPP